jgi:prepilin-type N-terminal cleavage/methylation domain-containing protein
MNQAGSCCLHTADANFSRCGNSSAQQGFTYLEVLITTLILAVAMVPALEALRTGVQGAATHQLIAQQQYAISSRMEEVLANAYGNLLAAAKVAGNQTTPSSYSDPSGQANRVLVYLALYDADANPFTITDANTDGDNDLYTGDTAKLLWLKAEMQNTPLSLETLLSR